jgi:hypothetical protein
MIVLPILRMKISLFQKNVPFSIEWIKILAEAKLENLLAARATYEWLLL